MSPDPLRAGGVWGRDYTLPHYKVILNCLTNRLHDHKNFGSVGQANNFLFRPTTCIYNRRFQTRTSPGIAWVKFWSIVLIAYHYIVLRDNGEEPSESKDNQPTVRGRDRIFLHP